MLRIVSAELDDVYDLRRDGKLIFRGPANDCFIKLQKIQSSSFDHALKHEGYTINPIMKDWKDYVGKTPN